MTAIEVRRRCHCSISDVPKVGLNVIFLKRSCSCIQCLVCFHLKLDQENMTEFTGILIEEYNYIIRSDNYFYFDFIFLMVLAKALDVIFSDIKKGGNGLTSCNTTAVLKPPLSTETPVLCRSHCVHEARRR